MNIVELYWQKPLIITSNVDYDRITKTSDMRYKRIYDRIVDMCLPVKMDGQSKRGIFNHSVFSPDSASFDLITAKAFETVSALSKSCGRNFLPVSYSLPT